eukprot:CAMPEP_0174710798 /NCGR_PEP_ID=MMETSP1094-20130205/12310_1 /TAXON_ID=156173 /ORGANISM="Chrysochromulina brevifilum, Strain UTEX LB 985" /LENGTH=83 /DNA_ID=CAMNT_0015909645 /DNA_START=70 /DNA_END=322 /DNA_ORIENTATION=-
MQLMAAEVWPRRTALHLAAGRDLPPTLLIGWLVGRLPALWGVGGAGRGVGGMFDDRAKAVLSGWADGYFMGWGDTLALKSASR